MVRDSVCELENGKAERSSDLVPEVVKKVGEAGVDMITNLANYNIGAEVNSRM